MALFRLCEDDPLIRALRTVFGANIVRVPDSRVQPLTVVVQSANRNFFRGALAPLLVGGQMLNIDITTSFVADIAGRKSRRVTLDLGLYILRGFLGGLGVPSRGLAAALRGVAYLAFAFPDVQRSAVDINTLGSLLRGRELDRHNPAAAILFGEEGYHQELLVIDSILSSSTIRLHLSGGHNNQVNLDLDGIERLLAGTGVSASASDASGANLTLESRRQLTFAFSCVRMAFDQSGRITALPPDLSARTLGSASTPMLHHSPDHVLLSPQPGLLIWDSR